MFVAQDQQLAADDTKSAPQSSDRPATQNVPAAVLAKLAAPGACFADDHVPTSALALEALGSLAADLGFIVLALAPNAEKGDPYLCGILDMIARLEDRTRGTIDAVSGRDSEPTARKGTKQRTRSARKQTRKAA